MYPTPFKLLTQSRKFAPFLCSSLALMAFTGCSDSDSDDDDSSSSTAQETLSMSFSGLEDLGSDYVYEGWLMDGDGNVTTAGRFSIDGDGMPSPASFKINADTAVSAVTYILTIEPTVGDDPDPSNVHVLAGDFVSDYAGLDVSHDAALGDDFSSVAGKVLIATPTTTTTDDNDQGYWFLDNSSGSPQPSLVLPELPDGWVYEGWAVVGDTKYSTGTFTSASGADSDGAGPTAGTDADAPNYPGQDFINPAKDLTPSTAVISIEPVPDNSSAPFAMKPLTASVGEMAAGTLVTMAPNLDSLPSGVVSFGDLPTSTTALAMSFSGLERSRR